MITKLGVYTFLKGMAMGAADVVPGVSGGTIAFITGIYERLLNAIKSFNLTALGLLKEKQLAEFWRHIDGSFLVSLFAGILTSIILMAGVIHHWLENYPILVWAFFFGLILASAWYVAKQLPAWKAPHFLLMLIGAAIAVWVSMISPSSGSDSYLMVFLSGAIAICAMILPGISGSFILVLLGMYNVVLGAITSYNFGIIAVFGAGAVIGLLSFSHLLSYLFKHYHDLTLATLAGFMLGSLWKVWPWKETLSYRIDRHGEQVPFDQSNLLPMAYEQVTGQDAYFLGAVMLAVLAIVLVLGLERFANQQQS